MNNRQAGAIFIFITVVLDAIGIGFIIPVLPDVMRRFISDPTEISHYFGYFISLYALIQFFASPLLGSLSDRFGRRSILLISLLGAGFDYLLMAYAPNLTVLFLGRFISGLTGASMTVAMAYMADVSNDQNRSKNFGMIGAAWGLGFIIGPALGGILGARDPHFPFIASACLNLLNFAFGLFILPESLPKEMRRSMQWRALNPLRSLKHVLQPSPILHLMLVYFLFQLAGQVHPAVWTLYTQHRFQWTTLDVGLSLAALGVLSAIVQGGFTGTIISRIGEKSAVFWGSLGYFITFLLFATAPQGWMMYAILILSAILGVAPPALQSLVSSKTPPQQQGELQGSIVGLMSLSAILSPLIATHLFASYSDPQKNPYLPGAPYFFSAAVAFLAFLILIFGERRLRRNSNSV